jgi:hypothetical protein
MTTIGAVHDGYPIVASSEPPTDMFDGRDPSRFLQKWLIMGASYTGILTVFMSSAEQQAGTNKTLDEIRRKVGGFVKHF